MSRRDALAGGTPVSVGGTPVLAGGTLVALGVAAAALFLAAFAAHLELVPAAPGFDDLEHLEAAIVWQNEGRLQVDGIFVRVPLWTVLLGTLSHVLRPGTAIALVQSACVLATLGLALAFARRASAERALPLAAVAVPLLVFASSPQVVLYARHAVNELWIGTLSAAVLFVGTARRRGGALALGLACGAAAMTKLSMGLLAVPAAIFAWRGGPQRRPVRLAQLALGTALVAIPLVALHAAQRPGLPLDNTSAFTLGEYTPREWLALGGPVERRDAGMASFRAQLAGDPLGYAGDAVQRLARWITRPATADFALFVPGFSKGAFGIWEHAVLWSLVLLAALGTTARTAPIWIFLAALPVLCTFPVHVPFTPKIVPIFPCLLLAPLGLARVLGKGEGHE